MSNAANKGGAATSGIFSRGRGYLSESVNELKKVQSPTRQETARLTGVVVLIIVFISMCLFVMDLVFNWVMTKMIG
jgi:preprotein translocase subunit SecE